MGQVFIIKLYTNRAFSKYIGVLMPFFPKDSLAMKIVELVLEKEKYKKLYEKEKADNECLKRIIQTKRAFEVRA